MSERWVISFGAGGTGYPRVVSVDGSLIRRTVCGPGDKLSANHAMLISAAPDLLAACLALDVFQRNYEANTEDAAPGNSHYAALLMEVVRQARVAIAKAEGGDK